MIPLLLRAFDTVEYANTSQYVNTIWHLDTEWYASTMETGERLPRLTRDERRAQTRERLLDVLARRRSNKGTGNDAGSVVTQDDFVEQRTEKRNPSSHVTHDKFGPQT